MKNNDGARFARLFLDAYREASANEEQTREKWSERRLWTAHMLDPGVGVLSVAANNWASEVLGDDKHLAFPEHRKIDLMIVGVRNPKAEWWESTPILLVEHENADDVEVEAWNLASMRARLKVLVFYYRSGADLESKTDRISRAVGIAEETHLPNGQYLLLAAPWKFSELSWRLSEWDGSRFNDFCPAAP